MGIEIIKDWSTDKGFYICVDVHGIYAESVWYRTREKLAFAMATNNVKWYSVYIEHDGDEPVA